VFEIGNSLREARLRQGLEIPRIEAETKIRGKYLRALEEEQFEVLPGETYVKGFLRTYADFLGLDGQLYLDEYNSRFAAAEEVSLAQSAASPRRRQRRVESNFVVVALAGIGSDSPDDTSLLPATTGETTATEPQAETPTTAGEEPAADPAPAARARLVLTAVRGDCWMQVRAGGVNGRLVWEGTLERGQTQRFVKYRRLWLELGAPANVNAKLNGRRLADFPTRPAIVVVTANGVRTVSSA